ncbi:MAG: hypothetical protein AAGJ38_05325 [Planctomycetota bacterium]
MAETTRACGSCTACCHSLVIEELGKPAFSACAHECEAGCNAYASRPASCRDFRCLWLDGHLDEKDRPDKLGVIFTTTHDAQVGVHPLIVEAHPGGADRDAVQHAIRRLTEKSPVLVLTPKGGTFHPRQRHDTTPLTIRGQAA